MRRNPDRRSLIDMLAHFRPDYLVLRPYECDGGVKDGNRWLETDYETIRDYRVPVQQVEKMLFPASNIDPAYLVTSAQTAEAKGMADSGQFTVPVKFHVPLQFYVPLETEDGQKSGRDVTNSKRQDASSRMDRAVIFGILSFFTLMEVPSSAFYQSFRRFAPYDDEGYLMITIRQLLDGRPLYTRVFSRYYGPFLLFVPLRRLRNRARSGVKRRAADDFAWSPGWRLHFFIRHGVYRATGSILFSALAQFHRRYSGWSRASLLSPGIQPGFVPRCRAAGFSFVVT